MANIIQILVTGANTGIGYEAVKAILQSSRPYHVFLGSRSLEKGQAAAMLLQEEIPDSKSTVEVVHVDLESDQSISRLYDKLNTGGVVLDALINNAGATFDIEHVNGKIGLRDCFTRAYNVNVAGTHVLTTTLMPLILKSSDPRLIFVSGLAAINAAAEKYFPTPPLPAGWPKEVDFETIGYRCSKVALNMLMLDYSHKLKADGVKVWGVGPGMLKTSLGNIKAYPKLQEKVNGMNLGDPHLGGVLLRSVLEGERDADIGKIVTRAGILNW